MNSELQSLLYQLEAVKAEGQAVASGLSHAQFNWRPAPHRYSVGDCLAHLNDSVARVLPAFDIAIREARSRGLVGSGPFKYGWLATKIARSMEPPPRWRMKSPRVIRLPPAERAIEPVLREFLTVRDELARRVRDADGLDLARAKITSPINRLLRLPLGAYFAFLVSHERRHLWQARQVRQDPGFPMRG
jgi:hypothetical protein